MEPVIVRIAENTSLDELLHSEPVRQSVVVPLTPSAIPSGAMVQLSRLDPDQFPKVVGLLGELKKVPGLEGIEVWGVLLGPVDIRLQIASRKAQRNFVTVLRCSHDVVVILDGLAAALSCAGQPLPSLQATAEAIGLLVKTVDGGSPAIGPLGAAPCCP